ncbi:unnamed protein product (mitochondrion) [Plasmodiophora brassicae]|uniref:Glycosyltransferase 61 catalytic domain-containing protein n=2 Tax=Plasmodiophora brassicae TaxID=37360 RepID=A0A3P3Y5G3_PLABS|nr:unnamed protein product [Plasmodiophora brassicae]
MPHHPRAPVRLRTALLLLWMIVVITIVWHALLIAFDRERSTQAAAGLANMNTRSRTDNAVPSPGCPINSDDALQSFAVPDEIRQHPPVIIDGVPPPGLADHVFTQRPDFDYVDIRGTSLPGAVAVLNNAFVAQERAYVYNCDFQWTPGGCFGGNPPFDPIKHLDASRPREFLSGTVVSIVQVWGYGFYHFFMEQFMRLALVYDDVIADPSIRILAFTMGDASNFLFDLAGIDPSRVISYNENRVWFARRLIVPATTGCGQARSPAVQFFNRVFRQRWAARNGAHLVERDARLRIVVQKRSSSRSLSNHDDLVKALANTFPDADIVVYGPSESMDDAVRKHYVADLIVAPHGAGISNVVFADAARVAVIEIQPPTSNMADGSHNECHHQTVIALGARYERVVARSGTADTPMVVDVDEVIQAARAIATTARP